MKLYLIRCIAGEMTFYRHEHSMWTSDINKADLYAETELPPGEDWDIVDTDDLHLKRT